MLTDCFYLSIRRRLRTTLQDCAQQRRTDSHKSPALKADVDAIRNDVLESRMPGYDQAVGSSNLSGRVKIVIASLCGTLRLLRD
jgi:hypothetical protein